MGDVQSPKIKANVIKCHANHKLWLTQWGTYSFLKRNVSALLDKLISEITVFDA